MTNLMKKLLILVTIILIGCDLGIDATIEVQNDSELVKEVSSSSFEEISSSSEDTLSSSSETIKMEDIPKGCNLTEYDLYNNVLCDTPYELWKERCIVYKSQNMFHEFESCECSSILLEE